MRKSLITWLRLGIALLLAAAIPARAIEFWFSPPGWNGPATNRIGATSNIHPYRYPTSPAGSDRASMVERAETFAVLFRKVLGGEYTPPGDTNLTIQLIPGVYPVTPLFPTSGWYGTRNYQQMSKTVLTIRSGSAGATDTAPATLQLVMDAGKYWPEYPKNGWENIAILFTKAYANESTNFVHFTRFVMENMTFDCNWDNLGRWSAPCHNGFKTSAFTATGRTGRISHVKVINCGASGMAPTPSTALSGVEGFPVGVVATDFFQPPFPGSGDPTAWVITDCEVTDFHSMRGGYACGLTVQPVFPVVVGGEIVPGHAHMDQRIPEGLRYLYPGCTWWFQVLDLPANRERRFATVRNCFVSVIGSAIGTASTGGIRFEDNIVIGGGGLNADTGHCRNIDVVNSVFLDVLRAANIGSWSPNSGSAFFQNWKFTGNLIRLERSPAAWDYNNYTYNQAKKAMEKRPAAIPIPAFRTNAIQSVFSLGSCNTMDLSSNRVTTRPRIVFSQPNPGDPSQASFRLVSRPTMAGFWGMAVDQSRSAPKMDGFLLSGVAGDFTSYTTLSPDPSARYSNRLAIAAGPAGIATNGLFGKLRRVERVTENSRLAGVKEVSISTPIPQNDGSALVQARWALHPTPLNAARQATAIFLPSPIGFLVQDARSNTVSVPPPALNGAISTLTLPASLPSGYYRIIAYVIARSASSTTFDPARDAWSETEHLKGTTVRFVTGRDLGENSVPIPGELVLARTGTGAFTAKIKQLTGVGRDAAYGKDFTLAVNGSPLPINDDRTFSVAFGPADVRQTIEVRPIKKAGQERTAAIFTLLDGGSDYGYAPSYDWPGFPPTRALARIDAYPMGSWRFSASVLFYDGTQ